MLGVRRATVAVAAGMLQDAGFIRYSRGTVTILDRVQLEAAACECYRTIREQSEQLLGEFTADVAETARSNVR